jgi:hypothetical protein
VATWLTPATYRRGAHDWRVARAVVEQLRRTAHQNCDGVSIRPSVVRRLVERGRSVRRSTRRKTMQSATFPVTASQGSVSRSRFGRVAPHVARVLLGLPFAVFGADGFLNFIPKPDPSTMPHGAVAFTAALVGTGYMIPLIKGTEVLVGAILLSNRFVTLALALLAPVMVNIILFHSFLQPAGIGIGLFLLVLQLFLVWTHRAAYLPMVQPGGGR